jgi:hypothetical protein
MINMPAKSPEYPRRRFDHIFCSYWNALMKLAEECAVETDISDLAHQHDHYLYGKPKKG